MHVHLLFFIFFWLRVILYGKYKLFPGRCFREILPIKGRAHLALFFLEPHRRLEYLIGYLVKDNTKKGEKQWTLKNERPTK